MRKLTSILAMASAAMASPALARDRSGYLGVEGGIMKVEDIALDYRDDLTSVDSIFDADVKTGFDGDLIGGYDFGMIRAEGEVGYKRASIGQVRLNGTSVGAADLDADGRARVLSGMANLLLDLGNDTGVSGFVGGGVGVARVKMRADLRGTTASGVGVSDLGFNGSDRGLAWQAIAGLRTALTDNIDLGVKYRLFNAKFQFDDGDAELDGRFRSHSLLASLIYNFVPPPLPSAPPIVAPPPPALPATQTCPDGSVILATDSCPVPPPPPPPPPPAPERG